MRVAMLSWEHPPLVVGGIAAHVDGLSRALVRQGHEVAVLTLHHSTVPDDYDLEGVRVLRAHTDLPWIPHDNFLAQMASVNHQIVQLAPALAGWRPDLVHAHDWLVAWAGDTLRALWDVPMVATIHATERGRSHGHLSPGQPQAIDAVEWWLTYQAHDVIACSSFMVDQVTSTFQLPPGKVHRVPNGVDPSPWAPPVGTRRGQEGPWILTWGRIQEEKGFQTLIEALPALRAMVPGVRVKVAGKGFFLDELARRAHALGVADAVDLLGFVPDDELLHLLHTCSVAVIPSLYEPFGIVALEAMAAGAPLVAAATGGLAEFVGQGDAGLLFRPGDAGDLAHQVGRLLTEPGLAERAASAALALVGERYTWDVVAAATARVYEACLDATGRPVRDPDEPRLPWRP